MIGLDPNDEARRQLEYLARQLADPERAPDHGWMRRRRDDIRRRYPHAEVSFRSPAAETPPSTDRYDPHAALFRG